MEAAWNPDCAGGCRTVPGGRAGSRLGTQRSRRDRGRRQGLQGSGGGPGFEGHRGAALREAHAAVPRARRLDPELHRAGGNGGRFRAGERDSQVTMTDFGLWKTAVGSAKGVTMKSYPALNHLFVAGEGKSLPAEYNKPGHVSPAVIDDIAKFVK